MKLIDLGVVRVPGLDDFPADAIPGTKAYMAPEMAAGEPGNELTDLFALGVTMFRAFTGEYPYANADAMSPPRRTRPNSLAGLRPDLPAWLDAALARAIASNSERRYDDMIEFALVLEVRPGPQPDRQPPSADPLRARPAPGLARHRRDPRPGAPRLVIDALAALALVAAPENAADDPADGAEAGRGRDRGRRGSRIEAWAWGVAADLLGQVQDRHALQPDLDRDRHGREKEAFAAEEDVLEAGHELDVELDRRILHADMAGMDEKPFARRQIALDDLAREVEEDSSRAVIF